LWYVKDTWEKFVVPERKKGEPLKKYVNRCVPVRRKEHPGESADRSVAACYGMGKTKKKKKKNK